MRVRNEDGGRPRGRELPDGPTRPRDREIRRCQGRPEVLGRGHEHVVVAPHARPYGLVVALARHVQDRRASFAESLDRELVQRLRACEAAEDCEHRTVGRQPEERAALLLRRTEVCGGIGRPTTRYFRSSRPSIAYARKTPGQRRRQPVREPEVGVRLGQRRRDPAQACREHHRPGDVPAAAEHHVRTPPREDPLHAKGARRPARRADETDRRASREARDGEGVELEAGVRNEPRLDAVGRPGERHRHPARAKSFARLRERAGRVRWSLPPRSRTEARDDPSIDGDVKENARSPRAGRRGSSRHRRRTAAGCR